MSQATPRLLLAAAFVLFAAWSLVVPINEAPDEPAHWQYARYLHDHWRLPHYAPGLMARVARNRDIVVRCIVGGAIRPVTRAEEFEQRVRLAE